MKKMYRIISGILIIAGILVFGGCSNFLNKQPMGVESSTSFFKTADQANRALVAAYGAIAWEYTPDNANWFNQWMIGDVVSDDAVKGGEGPSDIQDLEVLRRFEATTQNTITGGQYQVPYIGIYRANLVIKNVPSIDMDTTLRARYVAEAKFLRAWSYFILVKSFGDVPLVTHPLTTSEFCSARTPKAQVWAQIEADLTDAIAVLPEKSEYDAGSDLGRATKGAAKSMLVKAYMYQSKFTQAEPLAKEIEDSPEYGLEPNYADNFAVSNEDGLESIFELEYVIDPADLWTTTNQGNLFTIFEGDRSLTMYNPGWGFALPTQNLANEFEAGDLRKKATIIAIGDTLYKGTDAQFVVTELNSETGMCARKYLLEYQGADGLPDQDNAPNNWKAIRLADVILFHAEAANENGNSGDALASLNKVRGRVGLSPVTTTDKDSLRAAIYHERRVELALEGHRFWDVVRTGRGPALFNRPAPNDAGNLTGFVTGKNEIFAIPQIEVDVCNKITQNPGY